MTRSASRRGSPFFERLRGILTPADAGDPAQRFAAVDAALTQGWSVAAFESLRALGREGHVPAQFRLGGMYERGEGVVQNLADAAVWYREAAGRGFAPAQERLGLIYFTESVPPAALGLRDAPDGKAAEVPPQSPLSAFFPTGVAVIQDYAEAARWNRMAADAGIAPAQTRLGHQYALGLGVERDAGRAEECFSKAAAQQDPAGCRGLGILYSGGYGEAPARPDQAAHYLGIAAAAGDAIAQRCLGAMLLRGEGLDADRARAIDWLTRAAEQEDVDAMQNLGVALQQPGATEDLSAAEAWLRRAAGRGSPEAECALAQFLLNRSQDHDIEAVQWLRQAAERGHRRAAALLGDLHLAARGTPRNLAEAARWLEYAGPESLPASYTQLAWLQAQGAAGAEDLGAAVQWMLHAAKRGNTDALYNLGSLHRAGHGVELDLPKAAHYFRAAADAGHAAAALQLGLMYDCGEGVDRDLGQAANWINRSAEDGHLPARCAWGRMLIEGRGVSPDVERGVALLESALAERCPQAAEILFELHSEGIHPAASPGRAAHYLDRAVELGSPLGMRVLAERLLQGEEAPRDPQRAQELLARAAELGETRAQFLLGRGCLEAGDGAVPDLLGARRWFTAAAEGGDSESQVWMGDCSRLGWLDPPDLAAAEHWYRLAAARRNRKALVNLAALLERSESQDPALESEIFGLWLAAADAGHAKAQRQVGRRYLAGRGCTRDTGAAARWLQAAATQGDAKAAYALGRCFEQGVGVDRDPEAARRWLAAAARRGHPGAKAALPDLAAAVGETDRRPGRLTTSGLETVSKFSNPEHSPQLELLPPLAAHLAPLDGRLWRDAAAHSADGAEHEARDVEFAAVNARLVDHPMLSRDMVLHDEWRIYLDTSLILEYQLGEDEAGTAARFAQTIEDAAGDAVDDRFAGDTVLIAHHEGGEEWRHFLLLSLPRMLLFLDHFPDGKIALPAWQENAAGFGEALEAFGIHGERVALLEPQTTYRLGRGVLVDCLFNFAAAAPHPAAFTLLRGEAVDTVEPAVPPRDPAFIRRRSADGRTLGNGEAVDEVLARHGVTVYEGDGLSFSDQLDIWRRHDLIIATLGGDLANMVFARRGTVVLALSPDWLEDRFFCELSTVAEVRWTELRCGERCDPHSDQDDRSAFLVDVDLLDAALNDALRTPL